MVEFYSVSLASCLSLSVSTHTQSALHISSTFPSKSFKFQFMRVPGRRPRASLMSDWRFRSSAIRLLYCVMNLDVPMYRGNVVSLSSGFEMSLMNNTGVLDHEDTSLPVYVDIRLPIDVTSYLSNKVLSYTAAETSHFYCGHFMKLRHLILTSSIGV